MLLPIEAAEADLEVEEVVEEVEEVVDSEEVGAEAVEEVSKDWGRIGDWGDSMFIIPVMATRQELGRRKVILGNVRFTWLDSWETNREKESAMHAQLVGILAF